MPEFKLDPQKHHRKSIRLKGYDYSQPGAYFLTLVVYQHDCLFGEIQDANMFLNDLGKIADECWRAIPDHFPFVELGAHVVMPNHVHGVIVIHENAGLAYGSLVGAQHCCAPTRPVPTKTAPMSNPVLWVQLCVHINLPFHITFTNNTTPPESGNATFMSI